MPRSQQKELLDASHIPFEDIKQNMQELHVINKWLGGHAVTLAGLSRLLATSPTPVRNLSICEVGCGGGDNLQTVAHWCQSRGIIPHLTGIDLKQECITYAQQKIADSSYNWIVSDYRLVSFSAQQQPDILFASLFCHHLTDDDLTGMMQWMRANSRIGFFINDLHRHVLAYFSIKVLTQLCSNSYLVKNDAPLSVQRGFIRKDWTQIMQQAGISNYTLEWKWAFRWLLTVHA